jgi:hypothetical protein
MRRAAWLTIFGLTAQGALFAQEPPEGVKRSVDSFTGDTVWETKYGRLDDAQGCKRTSLAIVWKLVRGPHSRAEWLTYEYIDIATPFHKSGWINAARAAVNVDGRIIEAQEHPFSPHLDSELAGDVKKERAAFLLPDSTLRLVADAQAAKIRFFGTDRTCDGTVEQNMKDRLHSMLDATR